MWGGDDNCANLVRPQWIYYEAGFLICATIGVAFVVLTPIIGMCFCVCRCCENCGGEMHQRQRKNADCQRGFYTASLISTSILIMWVVMFVQSCYLVSHNEWLFFSPFTKEVKVVLVWFGCDCMHPGSPHSDELSVVFLLLNLWMYCGRLNRTRKHLMSCNKRFRAYAHKRLKWS